MAPSAHHSFSSVCVWDVHTRACEAHRKLCSFGCSCMMDIWKLNWLIAPPSQQPAGRPLAELRERECMCAWWGSTLEWWRVSTSGQTSCHRQPPLLDILGVFLSNFVIFSAFSKQNHISATAQYLLQCLNRAIFCVTSSF